ncbi:metallophosphoesterase [Psychroserpens ponticola]|uniref:Metallophosphoesterase n=1 Tax=Psychroserpens ponticola TaxID=2932268 RepID=A0ABY7S0H9_9FLAO|nr:metallophosphoesterase [Psychroserpens ponticola]WCO02847.1 metallophosphoesterase [Psychroserpens ponticola]
MTKSLCIFVLIFLVSTQVKAQNEDLISLGSEWSYYDNQNEPAAQNSNVWYSNAYDDSLWALGNAELGYGDNDEVTVVNNATKVLYVRQTITITDPSIYQALISNLVYDDGAVVYLNGQEIWRVNMPTGIINYSSFAASNSSDNALVTSSFSNTLQIGDNVIAVEIHQRNASSSDLSFDLELKGSLLGEININRGPYLQKASATSMVVKWRTETPTESKINFGLSLGNLTLTDEELSLKTEHELELTNLTPNTKYFYEIANNSDVILPESADLFFETHPTIGTSDPYKFWILGDAGTANSNQRDVRDAYYNYIGSNHTDGIIFLGDNAYDDGTDIDYQAAIFQNMYEDKLKNTISWSTLGNHDGYSADSNTQTGPYYDIFTFPTAGESGGMPSGTEAYYSFDYGNIHFIVLDSYDTNTNIGASMYNWALSDVQNTMQEWIVAVWHHPAYSKGSHDSDTENRLVDMRENFLPMLESNGVDLVLSGHSHSYERSYFLNGHYGDSDSFNSASMTVGANGFGDGKTDGTGSYTKQIGNPDGAVYITAGSSGKTSAGDLDHEAMYYSVSQLGSCVLEVDGDTMHVKFIRETGAVDDYFTIQKEMCTVGDSCNDGNENTINDVFDVNCQCSGTLVSETLIDFASTWSYYDNADEPSAQGAIDWNDNTYDDSTWSTGNAHMGYGDGDEAQEVNTATKVLYTRHNFNVADLSTIQALVLNLIYDDGAVVYLNGQEIMRTNMPEGGIMYSTFASSVSTDNSLATEAFSNLLIQGNNVIAVEIHQVNAGSSDLSFDLELKGHDALLFINNTWFPNSPTSTSGNNNALVYNNTYTINTDVTLNNLIVNPTSTIEVLPASSLVVNGNIDNSGTINLNSQSTQYSSLIVEGEVFGEVNYKRHINGYNGTSGNDLISSPVSGQTFGDFAQLNPNIYENPNNTDQKLFGPFNKTTGTYQTFSIASGSPELTTNLSSGVGYRTARDEAEDGLYGTTFTFSGKVVSSNVNVGLVNSGPIESKWNLIGNPYSSYINVQGFLNHEVSSGVTNINLFDTNTAAIYGYDGNSSNGRIVYNLATTTASTVIAPGQGFFVSADAINAPLYDLEFTPAMRSLGTADDFILGRNSELTYLKLSASTNTNTYTTDFYFTDNATLGLDSGYDASVFGDSAPSFAIYSQLVNNNQGIDFAIQSLNSTDLNNNLTIPLGVNATEGQQITLNITNTTLDENINIYLEDNVTNTFTFLNTSNYSFTTNSNLSDVGRFFLHFQNDLLSTTDNELNSLVIYNTSSPKILHIKGLVLMPTKLQLYDIHGRLIMSNQLKTNENNQQIDLSHINLGVYFIKITSLSMNLSKKIIID